MWQDIDRWAFEKLHQVHIKHNNMIGKFGAEDNRKNNGNRNIYPLNAR